MSQENVEVVREAVARFSVRDMEGLAAIYAEDAVVVAPEGWPEAGTFEGREAVMAQFTRLSDDWESHSMSTTRAEGRDDRVVAEQFWTATGASSGVPFETTVFGAYRVEDGQIAEARFFWTWDDALEAVGLRE